MALLKETTKFGKSCNYWGKYNLSYDKATDKTTFILYLFWDSEFAQANPLVQLDSKKFVFDGNKTASECYALAKTNKSDGDEKIYFENATDC